MGEKRNAYRLLVRKPEGKRPLVTSRRRWADNIRMELGGVGCGDVDWIGLSKDRNRWRALVNSVLNLRVPWNAGKLSSGLTSSGLSSSAQLHIVSYLVTSLFEKHYGHRAPIERNLVQNPKLRGLGPRANYTDRATAACRRS
jgi:hypothetical protein